MGYQTIILDIGQFSSKTGFGGEDQPTNIFFTLVGEPKYQQVDLTFQEQGGTELFVGNEISDAMGLYKISHPIRKGRIQDWNYFEKIIEYIFYNLRVDPVVANVLYAVHPLCPKEEKRKLFEIFIEKYNCYSFYPVLDSMLTLYSGGFQTGLIVEIGDSSTRLVPVYEGFQLAHAIKVIDLGGSTITDFMEHKLKEKGFTADSSVKKYLTRVIKEKACFTSLDLKEDLNRVKEYSKSFSLPDGEIMVVDELRFMVPELLFDPTLFNLEIPPLHEAIIECIEECDVDVRPKLLNNIFLSGGSSMFPNLKSRIYQELELLLAKKKKKEQMIRIIAPKERMFSVWIGGSILAMIPEFSDNWITRDKYYGSGIPENLL
jgi:actin